MADIKEKKRSSKSSGAPKKTAVKKQVVAQEAGSEVKQSRMVIADLLEKGKRNGGVLTYGEVVEALQKQDISPDEIEALFENFGKNGVDISDDADLTPEDLEKDEELQDVEADVDLSVPEGINIDDPVRMYLKEIGRVPLLTAEEEIHLATSMEAGVRAERRIKADKYIKAYQRNPDKILTVGKLSKKLGVDNSVVAATMLRNDAIVKALKEQHGITDNPEDYDSKAHRQYNADLEELEIPLVTVTEEEMKQLKLDIEDGSEAQKRLAEANLRLVVSIAKRYVGRGMLFLDLIQEGNLGLIKAVEKFDYTKGYKFSTYATWWIRQAITRSISDQARTIRVPVHMIEQINKVVRESRQLVQKLGREPTDEEIAQQLSWPVLRVKQVKNVAREPISLETPIGEEEDSSLGDFIEDKEVENPANQTAYTLLQEQLHTVLSSLPPREQEVLKMRFGLDDGYSLTLEEVGLFFNVTRERIRQIEAKALRRLRHPRRASGLKDFMDF